MSDEEVVKIFLLPQNLKIEEAFCRTFSENNGLSLVFNHDNSPRTDGKKIFNDPQFLEIYRNIRVLCLTEQYLQIGERLSENCWNALKMVTRALSIHECLHLLFTDFSIMVGSDVKCRKSRNKRIILADIFNIIEDSFIETYGASVYDNILGYLKFIRMATANVNPPMTMDITENRQYKNLRDYMNYMTKFVLFSPFVKLENRNPEIEDYITRTKDLFLTGSVQGSCRQRYEYARKIFDIILPLIPDDNDLWIETMSLQDEVESQIISRRTAIFNNNPKNVDTKRITRRLFNDLEGRPILTDGENINNQILLDLIEFEGDFQRINQANNTADGVVSVLIIPQNYGLKNLFSHKNITIRQNKIGTHYNLKSQYDDIVSQYKSTINTYKTRIFDILQAQTEVRTDKMIFGQGISSKHLGDTKGRFWYKKMPGIDVPPLSVLFLIDGSGSMSGNRIHSAKIASVIMHEVLNFNNIEHCFVEHRAGSEKPEIEVNILVDFNSSVSSKYNIMTMNGDSDNRDSLALLWAEKYLGDNASNENKVIVIISDGQPAHEYDKYYPPVSSQDTAQTVSRIFNRGTHVAAVALGEETYDNLKAIYPRLICCSDLTRLPAMLFGIVAKMLE